MLIGLIGESCTGKTTLAKKIKDAVGADIYSGKDYLRLAKNENDAKKLFGEKLASAVEGENIIYIITEKEQAEQLPEGAFRVLVTADLEIIKERFAARMNGKLPAVVEAMLEKKHGSFCREAYHLHVHNGSPDIEEVCRSLNEYMEHPFRAGQIG